MTKKQKRERAAARCAARQQEKIDWENARAEARVRAEQRQTLREPVRSAIDEYLKSLFPPTEVLAIPVNVDLLISKRSSEWGRDKEMLRRLGMTVQKQKVTEPDLYGIPRHPKKWHWEYFYVPVSFTVNIPGEGDIQVTIDRIEGNLNITDIGEQNVADDADYSEMGLWTVTCTAETAYGTLDYTNEGMVKGVWKRGEGNG